MPAEEVAAAAVGEAVTVDEILPKDPSEDVDGGSDEGSDESSADGSDDDSEENCAYNTPLFTFHFGQHL